MSNYGPERERIELTYEEQRIGDMIVHDLTVAMIDAARLNHAMHAEQAKHVEERAKAMPKHKVERIQILFEKEIRKQPPTKAMIAGFEHGMLDETQYNIAIGYHNARRFGETQGQSFTNGLYIADKLTGGNTHSKLVAILTED